MFSFYKIKKYGESWCVLDIHNYNGRAIWCKKRGLVQIYQMLWQIFWDVQPLGNESFGRDILNITKIIVDGTYGKNKRLGRVRYMDW